MAEERMLVMQSAAWHPPVASRDQSAPRPAIPLLVTDNPAKTRWRDLASKAVAWLAVRLLVARSVVRAARVLAIPAGQRCLTAAVASKLANRLTPRGRQRSTLAWISG